MKSRKTEMSENANINKERDRSMSPGSNGYEVISGEQIITKTGLHCHDFWQLTIFYSSMNAYAVDDNIYHPGANQLLIVPPYHMHGVLPSEQLSRYERSHMNLSSDFLQLVGARQIDFEKILSKHVNGGFYLFPLKPEDCTFCRDQLAAVAENSDHTDNWSRFCDVSRLFPVIRIILETLSRERETQTLHSEPEPLMHRVLSYLNAHFTEQLSLQQLSREFGISMSALSHDFLEYTNRSVYDYILYRRVMMAKQCLYENTPISEIAFRCGFSDYSNFLRAFRKIVGMSPSVCRKKLRSNEE